MDDFGTDILRVLRRARGWLVVASHERPESSDIFNTIEEIDRILALRARLMEKNNAG